MNKSIVHKSLAMAIVLILACCMAYWVLIGYPIRKFIQEETNSIPQFDILNENAATDIPQPPDGVLLKNTQKLGINNSSPIHGRLLVMHYSVTSGTELTDDEILSYYQSNLQIKGWNVLENNRDSYFIGIELKRDTSCIMIDFVLQEYEITIWHDYLKQSFSPTLPPKWLLDYFIDAEGTDIRTCPYY